MKSRNTGNEHPLPLHEGTLQLNEKTDPSQDDRRQPPIQKCNSSWKNPWYDPSPKSLRKIYHTVQDHWGSGRLGLHLKLELSYEIVHTISLLLLLSATQVHNEPCDNSN